MATPSVAGGAISWHHQVTQARQFGLADPRNIKQFFDRRKGPMLASMGNDPFGDNGSDSRQGVEFGGSGPVEMYRAITGTDTSLDRRGVRTRNEHLHPVDYRLGEVDRLCQPPRQRSSGSGNRISDPRIGRKVHQSWARDPASDVDSHRVC